MAEVTARERADAVMAKYADRMKVGEGVSAPPPQWANELRDDIENAINAAVSGEPVAKPAKAPVTHMPATGSHASDTRARK